MPDWSKQKRKIQAAVDEAVAAAHAADQASVSLIEQAEVLEATAVLANALLDAEIDRDALAEAIDRLTNAPESVGGNEP